MGPAKTKTKTQARTGTAAADKAPLDPEPDDSSASDDSASVEEETAPPPTAGKPTQPSAPPQRGTGRKPRRNAAGAPSSVLYLGHLPRHFQEPEILKFAKQFGPVQHVRLSRSRRTGGTRGYGFLQMAEPEVAVVAAGALSGYLLDGKRLVCHVVPRDRIHKNMVRTFAKPKSKQQQQPLLPRERSREHVQAISQRLLQRQAILKRKLQDAGIDYEFEGYTTTAPSDAAKAAATTKTAKPDAATKALRKNSADAAESAETPRRGGRRRQGTVGSEASPASQPPRRGRSGSVGNARDEAARAPTDGQDMKRKDSSASAGGAGSAPSARREPRSERKPPAAAGAGSRQSRRKSA